MCRSWGTASLGAGIGWTIGNGNKRLIELDQNTDSGLDRASPMTTSQLFLSLSMRSVSWPQERGSVLVSRSSVTSIPTDPLSVSFLMCSSEDNKAPGAPEHDLTIGCQASRVTHHAPVTA